ncbi:MAG: sigma-54-dependent Fis family transcriptional regulator [Gammaproteobacteria bacterium]|nr:sigma-54-dependent Fis family transcriptional regulator [Gammaproteobacteria bacterium]
MTDALLEPPARILIIEDEALFAKAVARRLTKAGYTCEAITTLAEGERALTASEPDLLILDMRLPDGSGLDFIQRLRSGLALLTPILAMSAYGEIEDAVTAMKLGAADYLKKPIDLDELLLNVRKILSNQRVSQQLEYSKAREAVVSEAAEIIGKSPIATTLRAQILQMATVAGSAGGVAPTVLIVGETGTGKDLAARMLHQQSSRAAHPFVHVDCAALPKDLIEAELFGHVRGAFTSAVGERTGLIEAAEHGVLFLDEIGELPLELQAKLLAVLERRSLRRVGSSQERRIDAWFIAATNRNVEKMVTEGTLRSDLYFRLNVLSLYLAPLRERGADIVMLAEHCGRQLARRYGFPAFELGPQARAALLGYHWPGNIRELRHVIERALLLSSGVVDSADSLMLPSAKAAVAQTASGGDLFDLTLDQAEKTLIEHALRRTGENVSEAARQLGITRMTMRYRMKQHGL